MLQATSVRLKFVSVFSLLFYINYESAYTKQMQILGRYDQKYTFGLQKISQAI